MSVNARRIYCTNCDFETIDLYEPIIISYYMNGCDPIEVSRAKGWCYDCNNYRDIEDVNKDDLKEKLLSYYMKKNLHEKELKNLSTGLFSKFKNNYKKNEIKMEVDYLEYTINDLEIKLSIAEKRKSNSRCLVCWGERTVPLDFKAEETNRLKFKNPRRGHIYIDLNFVHDCGGHLYKVYNEETIRFFFKGTRKLILDIEGNLMGK